MTDQTIRLAVPGGLTLTLSSRGAAWLACELDEGGGRTRPLILPRASADDASADRAFLGATVGRYANRIAGGRIARDGRQWQLDCAAGNRHHLHGGPGGFHAQVWQAERLSTTQARFTLISPEGDQGYPGELHTVVTYALVDAMTIEMDIQCTTTAATPVAITNHAYFNLDAEAGDARRHSLQVAAARFSPVDAELIPTGPPASVAGTTLDFRAARPLGQDWLGDEQQRFAGGVDHALLLDAQCAGMQAPAAQLTSAGGDLSLAISTTLPALQVYTGQYLEGISTAGGRTLGACAGVALEPGYLPDSPNHPEWPQPSCWLEPGQRLAHRIRYAFERA